MLSKEGRLYRGGLTHIRLQMGDTLVLQGPWERFHILRNRPQPRALTFATPLEGEIMRPKKALLALIWLVIASGFSEYTCLPFSNAFRGSGNDRDRCAIHRRSLPIRGLDDRLSACRPDSFRDRLRKNRYGSVRRQ